MTKETVNRSKMTLHAQNVHTTTSYYGLPPQDIKPELLLCQGWVTKLCITKKNKSFKEDF